VTAAERLVALLTRAGRTLAIAESLTGGKVADALVGVPGASSCLRGAVVAYATDLKADLLDVPAELLERLGPVHPDVARAMARGARTRLGADYGVATTGVAGPEPQDGVPPGTFHVAVAGRLHDDVVSVSDGPSDRAAVRQAATDAALDLALGFVRADVLGTGEHPGAL
jgi:nicotinamide-nucleotide amidase